MDKKLVVLIPAFNEENFIASAINEIPKTIAGIGSIEIVVVNDGSTDSTAKAAHDARANKIIHLGSHRGLGTAIRTGLNYSVDNGADIMVIFDADNQYYGKDIEKIVLPILTKNAPVVVSQRDFRKIKRYPLHMKLSQHLGSRITGFLFRAIVLDVASSLRAYTKETAKLLAENLRNPYEEAVESVCFMAKRRIPITWVPVDIRYPTRPSRLITSKFYFVRYFFTTLGKYLFPGRKAYPRDKHTINSGL